MDLDLDLADPDPDQDPTPDPTHFFSDFKDAKQNLLLLIFSSNLPAGTLS